MPVFRLEGEYVMPKVEFAVHIEAKDEEEAREFMRELGNWQSKMPAGLHDDVHFAKIEKRTSVEDTCWNYVKPVDGTPDGVEVVKLPEGWRGE